MKRNKIRVRTHHVKELEKMFNLICLDDGLRMVLFFADFGDLNKPAVETVKIMGREDDWQKCLKAASTFALPCVASLELTAKESHSLDDINRRIAQDIFRKMVNEAAQAFTTNVFPDLNKVFGAGEKALCGILRAKGTFASINAKVAEVAIELVIAKANIFAGFIKTVNKI